MKAPSPFIASVSLAILSIASANAAPANVTPPKAAAPWVGCSGSSGMYSPTCRNLNNATTYVGCMEDGLKIGWRSVESSWYCTSLGLK
jgi:hypothetical protein